MNRFVRVFVAFFLSISSLAIAQSLATGIYPLSTFDSRGFDSVNLGNLNTHFEIPIVAKQGRGINFDYSIVYDGLVWSPSSSTGTRYWQPAPAFGMRGQVVGSSTGYITYSETTYSCPPYGINGAILTNFVFHESSGASHVFNYSETSCDYAAAVKTGNGSALDGSGFTYVSTTSSAATYPAPPVTGHIVSSSGSTIYAPYYYENAEAVSDFTNLSGSITDSNGNTVSNNGNGTFTDTLGVTALTISGPGLAGLPVTLTYPVTLQSGSSTTATATVYFKYYTVQTNFGCSGITEYGATGTSLVDHVTLADGQSTYSFTYESTPGVSGSVTGRLASITLPTGGAISYSYTAGCSGAGINADGTVGSLTRVTSDGTRSYTRATINGNATSTTLQDENGNQTLYQFAIAPYNSFYETHRQAYQGSIDGTPLFE
jgi:hypothetical protein